MTRFPRSELTLDIEDTHAAFMLFVSGIHCFSNFSLGMFLSIDVNTVLNCPIILESVEVAYWVVIFINFTYLVINNRLKIHINFTDVCLLEPFGGTKTC